MKKNNEFIVVKGCAYKVIFFDDERSYLGRTDFVVNNIYIYSKLTKRDLEKTIFHELLHAYFYECGLMLYGADETLVTYLDSIYPELGQSMVDIMKMYTGYKKVAKNV